MTDVPVRELRNDVSAVLRRVEAGERLRVTVRGNPVAELVPLTRRRTSMSWDEFGRLFAAAGADAGLARELRDLAPDSTDDVPIR